MTLSHPRGCPKRVKAVNIFVIRLKNHPLDPLPCAQGRGSRVEII